MSAAADPQGVRRAIDEGLILDALAQQPTPPRVLVAVASLHGSTDEIAAAIARTLRHRGLAVDVVAPEDVDDVAGYDGVVLGSAVYGGRWLGAAGALAQRCGPALRRRPVWLLSSGPVGDPGRRLVRRMAADPVDLHARLVATHAREHRMFAGRLERHGLSHAQRAALTLVRGLDGDFRDWDAIARWADEIADVVTGAAAPTAPDASGVPAATAP